MQTNILTADLLIIGGGSAGCMAAIRALELAPRIKVVIFEKGDIQYSGSIARGMDALNIVILPNISTPEEYVASIRKGHDGVVDAPPSHEMAKRSFGMLKKLEDWGVEFPIGPTGDYRTLQIHPQGKFLVPMDEPDLKVMISQKAQALGAKVINRVLGHRLLMDGSRVAGAIGLDVRTGEIIACRANAVILAAGGQARFSLPNSGYLYGTFDYPGNTGDGYAMAFRAGAELVGMECSRRAMLIKDANLPLLAVTTTRGARVLDAYDQIVLDGNAHKRELMTAAWSEGRGPLRVRLSHLPNEAIEEIEKIMFNTERPMAGRFLKRRGIDFRKDDIELWPTEAQLCGGHGISGIYINEKAESKIPGLYAAGDVASVAKQCLTGAFVFGEIAAEESLKFIMGESPVSVDGSQIKQAEDIRDRRFSSRGRPVTVQECEYKIRRLIGDYVISPKNEYKLRRWLEWADVFRREIESEVMVRNGHELSRLYEAEHIIDCACFSAAAAIERKESRWGNGHKRTDYPDRDDKNFFAHIVIKKGHNDLEIVTEKRPVLEMD